MGVTDPASAQRVLLLCPPFQLLTFASLATARLATFLRRANIDCAEAYLHFDFARLLGEARYNVASLAGLEAELLFAEGLHGNLSDDAEPPLERLYGPRASRQELLARFERSCLDTVSAAKSTLVGITTSNNQLMAALWLAQRIKHAFPGVRIVLGGSACGDPMGPAIAEAYECIDWVVSGYGETPLLSLARGHWPEQRVLSAEVALPIFDLPVAEYDSFLRQAGEFDNPKLLWLTYEGSRGCWWGMRQQCRFCGLSGQQLYYEEKRSALVVEELRALWDKYHRWVFATDLVLSSSHLKEVVPALAEAGDGPPLFYEVRAHLTEADVIGLHRARIREIQPGIESLSSRLLRIMSKGTTMIQNVALLKWCKEQGIWPRYNLLYRIPGESEPDYDEQIALFRAIAHLTPPQRLNPIRLDRYSPYFEHYGEYGWKSIAPRATYRLLHPHVNSKRLYELSYHFDGEGGVEADAYLERLEAGLREWQERYRRRDGLFQTGPQRLQRRTSSQIETIELDSIDALVVERSHNVIGIDRLIAETGATRARLEALVSQGILLIEGQRAIALAVRLRRK